MRDSEPEPDLSVVNGRLEDFGDAHVNGPHTALAALFAR